MMFSERHVYSPVSDFRGLYSFHDFGQVVHEKIALSRGVALPAQFLKHTGADVLDQKKLLFYILGFGESQELIMDFTAQNGKGAHGSGRPFVERPISLVEQENHGYGALRKAGFDAAYSQLLPMAVGPEEVVLPRLRSGCGMLGQIVSGNITGKMG